MPMKEGIVYSGITTPTQHAAPLPPTVYKAAAAIKQTILASRPEVGSSSWDDGQMLKCKCRH